MNTFTAILLLMLSSRTNFVTVSGAYSIILVTCITPYEFKILLLTFKVLHGLAPSYISDLIRVKPVSYRYSLRSADGILQSEPKFKT